MKSKTSCFNKTIFKKNITHFWPIWLMILLWNLFFLPFMIYNSSMRYQAINDVSAKELAIWRANDILSLVQVFMNPIPIFVFSVIAVMAVFSYLYNGRSANAIHSLPVTRKELFITNFISGFLFLAVPEAVGFLIGILVGALCGYTSMNYLLMGLLFALGLSFFFYSFTVCIAMFTGQLLAVPIFSLIINFLYVGFKRILIFLMEFISYGLTGNFSDGNFNVLSPLYYLSNAVGVNYGDDSSGEYMADAGFYGHKEVICYAIVAVVMIAAAYFIYKIRDMETAGSLISIPWICPVFRWGAAFCGGMFFSVIFCSIFSWNSNRSAFIMALLSAVFFGVVFFFGAQMFLEKGFRVFQKKRILECGAFFAVMAILIIGIECDVLGIEKKIPDASDVKMAFISANYAVGGSDSESVEQVREIHRQIVDSKKEFEEYADHNDGESYFVMVRYALKDGSILERSYQIPSKEEMLLDEATVIGKVVKMSLAPKSYLNYLFGINYENVEVRGCEMSAYGEDSYDMPKNAVQEVYEAVIKDVEEGNFKEHILRQFGRAMDDGDYVTALNFEYFNEAGDMSLYDAAMKESNRFLTFSSNGYSSVSFDKNCRHIIDALINTKAIKGEGDLLTEEDAEELEDEDEEMELAQ